MNLKHAWDVWGEWEIRVLVLTSLALQVFLLFAGGLRKRVAAWWLRMPLWLAYLLADYVAIYALGNLSQNQKLRDGLRDAEMRLLVFWAPFLILHLGGQDTITAFAVEDNELWLRHLLSLVSQVLLAGYVYWKSSSPAATNIYTTAPAIIMFVAGVTKYGERTLALRAASMGSLRSSMLTPPDPGPNYAKFVEECQSRTHAGLVAKIVIVPERPPDADARVEVRRVAYGDLVWSARRMFGTFQRLFVDLILSFQDRIDSLAFFRTLEMEQAFKVVEVELVLMYESLHSKAPVIHGWLGRGLRVFTLAAPVVSLVLFARAGDADLAAGDSDDDTRRVDVGISYVLLGGAVLLETYAIFLMVISPWTYADLRAGGERLRPAAEAVLWLIELFQPETRARWSDQMSQYNLISYCLHDEPRWYKGLMEWLEWRWNFRVKTMWDSWRYTNTIAVSTQLKQLVFEQLKGKAESTMDDPKSYRKLGEHRGQWALQRKGLYQQLGWSVDCEFDESILLWHIATDLCFYDANQQDGHGELPAISREVSSYMLFLLVRRPFMMTASIGQIRFGDTCAEAKGFFRRAGDDVVVAGDEAGCAERLRAVDTSIAEPRDVKGDRSKSVLFQACKLARQLLELPESGRWRLVAGVWVEMLCYAAGKCGGSAHARQLSQGGELLTVVWLLMAHFGVGDQYRVESGHARAKLVVDT
ncbi:hypothetical protein HU200_049034 [Digitaria exilis]|uniref:DUF4220 domain-containing protein n=1 Tax=Digitaria exilis TaxID=1010633 RepID=A0A835AR32_9POAL|nr:hypothetical protein HU200_049034 [Digitaria exilis]CAB3490432.1 unnamed protein product [Digitaria exilis]CAB3503589.1 unnamed protein product [Digitaria exilis]